MAPAKKVASVRFVSPDGVPSNAALDDAVLRVIARVADKWTMCVLEVLEQNGVVRFGRIATLVGGISQRMLTKTLRQLEEDGFVTRTVYPEVPPKVEYALTTRGHGLCAAFCGVWRWVEEDRRTAAEPPPPAGCETKAIPAVHKTKAASAVHKTKAAPAGRKTKITPLAGRNTKTAPG